jgi:hypothetical protein
VFETSVLQLYASEKKKEFDCHRGEPWSTSLTPGGLSIILIGLVVTLHGRSLERRNHLLHYKPGKNLWKDCSNSGDCCPEALFAGSVDLEF